MHALAQLDVLLTQPRHRRCLLFAAEHQHSGGEREALMYRKVCHHVLQPRSARLPRHRRHGLESGRSRWRRCPLRPLRPPDFEGLVDHGERLADVSRVRRHLASTQLHRCGAESVFLGKEGKALGEDRSDLLRLISPERNHVWSPAPMRQRRQEPLCEVESVCNADENKACASTGTRVSPLEESEKDLDLLHHLVALVEDKEAGAALGIQQQPFRRLPGGLSGEGLTP
mmetsp:Transcript_14565/g.31650  ORF Transcript_14565/g.31650 Transcript_14565/m.31650 type:complete len:228 (-) Transcript_14565:215-898(-)